MARRRNARLSAVASCFAVSPHCADAGRRSEVIKGGVAPQTPHSCSVLSQKMKTEDKSTSVPRVRIAVLGQTNVGKSALTVRYLTRRFIVEYRSDTDLLYRQTVSVNNSAIEVEIVDVSGETTEFPLPLEQVQWADGCVVVYSITDKESFKYAKEALQQLQRLSRPVVLLGNKSDLEHLRQVEEAEGRAVAAASGPCSFFEVSAVDNSADLYLAFDGLLTECRGSLPPNKTRKFSVSKMIGTLIGSGGKAQPQPGNGTVVEFQKSDLHRSRVLKRRQNFTATASL